MTTRFGVYHDAGRTAYPMHMAAYRKEQASRGLSASAAMASADYCSNPVTALTLCVEGLLEAGLAFPGEPLLTWGEPMAVYQAMQQQTRRWPIPVLCVGDDSNPGQSDWIQAATDQAHSMFFKSATTLAGYFTKERKRSDLATKMLGETVDTWIIHAPTFQQDTAKNARALGKGLWAYYTDTSNGDYERMRYLGLWSWAQGVEQTLVWAYVHDAQTMIRPDGVLVKAPGDVHSYTIPRHDGTVQSTPGYEGYEQGIKDCRVLEAAEIEAEGNPALKDYLQTVRWSVPFSMPRAKKPLPEARWQGEAVVAKIAELVLAPQSYGTNQMVGGAR